MRTVAYHLVVFGRVQNVGYRRWVKRHATRLGVVGWVRNCEDELTVEAVCQGEPEAVSVLIREMKHGPPLAHTTTVMIKEMPYQEDMVDFLVIQS